MNNLQPIEMTATAGKPTVVIPTGPDGHELFVMIGEFDGHEGVIIAQSNGEGGIDVLPANAEQLMRALARDLGYDVVAK
jgi:hypothetical protein